MARYTVQIDCDNAAFEENPEREVGRILSKLGRHLEQGGHPDVDKLYDINGNAVGRAFRSDWDA